MPVQFCAVQQKARRLLMRQQQKMKCLFRSPLVRLNLPLTCFVFVQLTALSLSECHLVCHEIHSVKDMPYTHLHKLRKIYKNAEQRQRLGVAYGMHDKIGANLSRTTFCVAASTSAFVHAFETLTLTWQPSELNTDVSSGSQVPPQVSTSPPSHG